MDPVDIFAGLVTRHFRERPALTRGIIRTGYAAQQTLLRLRPEEGLLPSQQYLARICMDYTRRPLRRPETSALVNLFFPCELLHAMDLSPQCVEGFSAFLCGGRCERGFMQLAEEVGVPDTYCSFHKGLLGAVFARTVQKPRFILTTNTVCDANTTTFDAIARHYDMPRRMIDVPYEETPGAVLYVADQLRGLVGILEEELGRGMDPARLRLAIDRSNVALAAQIGRAHV